MCLDTGGRVIDIDGDVARVEFGAVRRSISLVLLRADEVAVGPGDWLRTHTGLAVERMDPDVAAALATEAGAVRNEADPDVAAALATEMGSVRNEADPDVAAAPAAEMGSVRKKVEWS